MRKLGRFLLLLLGLAILAALGWSLWQLGVRAVDWLGRLDTPTRTGFLTLFGVLMVPVITFGTQFYLGKRQSREQAIRDRRTEFYDQVINLFMDIMGVTKAGNEIDPNEYGDKFRDLYSRMLTYASPRFIRAWNRYIKVANGAMADASSSASANEEERKALDTYFSMAALEGVLTELRRDLGHRVASSQHGNLISVFVTDLDKSKIEQIQNAKKLLDRHLPL